MSNEPLHPYVSLVQKDMENLRFILGMIEKDGDYEFVQATAFIDLEVLADTTMYVDKAMAETLMGRVSALRDHYAVHFKPELMDAQSLRWIRQCFIEENHWTMATGVLESNLDEIISLIREDCLDKLKKLREDYVDFIKKIHADGVPISDSDLEFTWAI